MPIYYQKKSFVDILIVMVAVTSFTVVTITPSILFYSIFILSFLYALILSDSWRFIEKDFICFLVFFLLPSLVGFLSYPFSMILEGWRFDYSSLNIIGRVLNLFFFSLFLIFLHSYISVSRDKIEIPFRWYWMGILVLMLSGLWHFFDVFLNLVNFPFETRSDLHSTYGNDFGFYKRITGIAREPSYFVMFAIDFIILSILLSCGIKRWLAISIGFFLVVFSLSPSGYITFFGALSFSLFFTYLKFFIFRFKFNIKFFLIFFVVFVLFLSFIFYFSTTSYFNYFYNRISNPLVLESSRAYMSYMPFLWAWKANLFSFLFGHGIKSYSIIGTTFNVPDGEPVHATSNNIYTDIFWESGLVGLILILGFFSFVIFRIFKSRYSKLQVFIAFFVIFDLMFSGLFRADFASFRFFILLYLVYVLTRYDVREVKGFYI